MLRYVLLLVLLPSLLVGCDGDGEGTGSTLEGTVVDATGAPIEGVAIGLRFELEEIETVAQMHKALTTFYLVLDEATHIRLEVLDYCGHHVATVADQMMDAGEHHLDWRWVDDDGAPLANGLYTARLSKTIDEETETIEHELFLQVVAISGIAERPQTHTDEEGRFVIPLRELPLGETINYPAEEGGVGPSRVTEVLTVYAFLPTDPPTRVGSRTVTLRPGINRVDFGL